MHDTSGFAKKDECMVVNMCPLSPHVHNAPMRLEERLLRAGVSLAVLMAMAGSVWLLMSEWTRLRNQFDVQARIVHRLISQQMVQHEAVLSTLALLPPAPDVAVPLTSVYPHIRSVQVVQTSATPITPVPLAATNAPLAAPAASIPPGTPPALPAAILAVGNWAAGQYSLQSQGTHARVTLTIDLSQWPLPPEWPAASPELPLAVDLMHGADTYPRQPQNQPDWEWQLEATKAIASSSQPFTVRTRTHLTWHHVPWWQLGAWWLAIGTLLWFGLTWVRQRHERQRAQALLKLDQVSRLGTLAEVGAGVAHEINQPLTAVLANAQAARRALKDNPPDIALLRHAIDQAVEQAKRAADVVARLRRLLDRPGERAPMRRIDLTTVARHVLDLLAPSLSQLQVPAEVRSASPVHVLADPVALEQIVHNLVQNALQSLEQVPATERLLTLTVTATPQQGVLTVTDTGAGIAPDLLPRLFEPFLSTRPGGLGLGLTLCETLANHMGGHLRADHHAPRGALFELQLPLSKVR